MHITFDAPRTMAQTPIIVASQTSLTAARIWLQAIERAKADLMLGLMLQVWNSHC